MDFCANNGAADNISDKPKSVNVRFILFISYTEGKYLLEIFRGEVTLLVYYPHLPKRHECARFSDLPSSKGVTRRGLHLQSWISRAAARQMGICRRQQKIKTAIAAALNTSTKLR
jgi:hypothetical protein